MCTSALRWTLVLLVSLVITVRAMTTDLSHLVTTGVPATPKSVNSVDIEPTEGPTPPLKVSSLNVTSVIKLRYAHTTVFTKMRNPAKISQEATFRILLPETAFITGFVMTLNGIPYAAYVKEKEEAKSIYTQAVNQGLGAAHVAAKARDSNHFTVSVNVEPLTEAFFNLTYEELLTRRLEVYNHVVNLNPGRLVPDLTVNIFIKEGRKITTLRVPKLRTGNEVDAQESDTANEFATIERNSDNTEAYIKFAPNLEQQQTLIQVYAEKSKKSASQSDSRRPHSQEQSGDGVLGQFVVQYDVERDPNNGEVMVNDGYFVHFFSPSDLKALNKHAIFVLDTSFSMWDRKIEQLKEAMTSILSELRLRDYFSIIEFNTNVQVHDVKNLEKHENSAYGVLPLPTLATLENIQKAKMVIQNLQATGSTNINDALDVAIEVAKTGISKSNVISAHLFADDEDQKPAPLIIFLTDGEPTEGETNVERILDRASELNRGPNQTPIFTLAFGNGADRDFLRNLSLRNSGFLRHIYEAADAAQQLQHFYSLVADPLLSHIRFTYPADQVDDASITKHKFKTLFRGAEFVVAGKLLNKDVKRVTPTVTAISSVGPTDFTPKPVTPVETGKTYWPLERLWVYLHVKQLLDQKDAGERAMEGDKPIIGNKKKPEQEALELALQYSFVTPLTSLVVVRPNDTVAVNAESVDKADVPSNPAISYNAIARHKYSSYRTTPAPILHTRFHPVRTSMTMTKQDSIQLNVGTAYRHGGLFQLFLGGGNVYYDMDSVDSNSMPTTLEDYNLSEFQWLEQYLDAASDSVNLPVNGITVNLKLFKGTPSFTSAEPACTNSLKAGSVGKCKYLTECAAAKNISNLHVFLHHRCEREGYAAVCCPV